ncbi:MAG: BppU family phage baseplate upper protein [Clostridia bacterium]|nr:BppU family phage baseplate upper protein [Clostridia bacterium]
MPQIVCRIALDVSVNDAGQVMMAKQGDRNSRLLCVRFTDCGRPISLEAETAVLLNVARREEAFAYAGAVTGEGEALFTIPAFALEEAGAVECDVTALDADGGRLTSSKFTIMVEESVCPDGGLGSGEGADLAAQLLAEQTVQTLVPEIGESGYRLLPALNRKYALDLSDAAYTTDGAWSPIILELPTPASAQRENWILIYCHALVHANAGAVTVDWGADRLFADGVEPLVTMGDFDIVCTYSPIAAKWQIGVVQYAVTGGTV